MMVLAPIAQVALTFLKIQAGIIAGLDEYGFLGEVHFNEITRVITISNTNISDIEFVSEECGGDNNVSFTIENCCDTDGFNPPPGIGLLTSLTDDLYFQKNTFTGLDITRIDLGSDCATGMFRNEYTYDADHRVREMKNKIFKYPELITGRYNTSYTYDPAGNIGSLSRKGLILDTGDEPTYGIIDNLIYAYNNQRLNYIVDDSGINKGLITGTSNYTYDDNGNLITDSGKSITSIAYNVLNLPEAIDIQGEKITNEYTFGGEKIKKKTSGDEGATRVYLGGVEFLDGNPEAYNHGDGRVVLADPSEVRFQYKIADHLGNTVVLFEDKDEDGWINSKLNDDDDLSNDEVLQRNLYYPFGLALEGAWRNEADTRMAYLYNGKELNEEFGLNWLSFGFREYDAVIGRFPSVDPIADQFAHVSPFNYAENKPISHIDLWGLQAVLPDPFEGSAVSEVKTRTVNKGDTFNGIANDLGVDRNAFRQANPQIENFNQIQPGQELNIPQASTPTSLPLLGRSNPFDIIPSSNSIGLSTANLPPLVSSLHGFHLEGVAGFGLALGAEAGVNMDKYGNYAPYFAFKFGAGVGFGFSFGGHKIKSESNRPNISLYSPRDDGGELSIGIGMASGAFGTDRDNWLMAGPQTDTNLFRSHSLSIGTGSEFGLFSLGTKTWIGKMRTVR